MNTKPYKGQQVQCGQSIGTVLRMFGANAVQVWTAFERPEQDFLTCKVTVIKGYRKETWPMASVHAVIPQVQPEP